MEKFKAFIKHKWFLQGLGLFTLALIIWFVGPLIAIADVYLLESVSGRLLLILLIGVFWVSWQAWQRHKAKKNNDEFVNEMDSGDHLAAEEKANMQDRFHKAIATLKTSSTGKKGSAYVYELPWYIIIGPPGSGKTTALLNSGLNFPLEDKIGMEAVKGIGGTRDCDWWFTSEAVLIDTAGRFTTQDSHASVDKASWQSFMDMLKKYRKQRPINGALVAMSLSDLMEASEEELTLYAKTIRRRIEELSENLKISFPAYFMYTKCDLVSGFNEFFSYLTEEQAAQVWGHTFQFQTNGGNEFNLNEYERSFDDLVAIIKQQMIPKINAERDPQRKSELISFPAQLESLKHTMLTFLSEIFTSNRFQEGALLRGVYFTSGTQEGTPFDRLLGNIAQNMGMQQSQTVFYSGKGKSFFIKRLLTEVIFAESELAGVDQKLKKWMKRIQYASLAASVLLLAGLTSIWTLSYGENSRRIDKIDTDLLTLDKVEYKEPSIEGAEFKAVLTEVDLVRDTSQTFDDKSYTDFFGLDQESAYRSQLDSLYAKALTKKLLPVIAGRLEELMLQVMDSGDSALLYDLLKAYLMYSGINEKADVDIEPQWLQGLMAADWQNTFFAEPAVVEQLKLHHKHLLSINYAPYKEDKEIVAAARNTLMRLPLAEQVYLNVKQSLLADHSGDLLFRDMAGNLGLDVFRSRSGKDLNSLYVPGLYTKSGFYKDFLTKSSARADDYLNNDWVLGEHNSRRGSIDKSTLQKNLYEYYYRDYIGVWSQMLRDLAFQEPESIQHGVTILEQANGINGPVENLIYAVVQETDLSSPLSGEVDTQAVSEALGTVSGTAQRVVSQANQLSRRAEKAGLSAEMGEPVTRHFALYHLMVSSKRGDPPVDRMLEDSRNFALFINQTLFDGFSEKAAYTAVNNRIKRQGRDPFSSLKSSRSIVPNEVKDWLDEMSGIGWSLLLDESRAEISSLWRTEVFNFYQSALAGKYPLSPQANQELELRDFSEFFRPGGRLDSFMTDFIKPFVNTNSSRWSEKEIDGQKMVFGSGVLGQLEIASQVTELFFERRALEPSLSFVIKPVSLDGNVTKVNITLGEQNIAYAHGPRLANEFTWPLASGRDTVRLQFTSVSGDNPGASESGPWSLFKLFDSQQLNPTEQNSVFNVDFSLQGYKARFELRADTEFNPIGGRILQSLNLPEAL